MKDRLHDTRGTKSRDYLETIGDKNFGELKGIRQIRQTFLPPKFFTVYGIQSYICFKLRLIIASYVPKKTAYVMTTEDYLHIAMACKPGNKANYFNSLYHHRIA